VDPGAHRVEAWATQKKPWAIEVTVGDGAEKKSVAIPSLEDAPLPAPAPPAVVPGTAEGGAVTLPLPPAPPPPSEPGAIPHANRTLFYVVGTAGLASLAFGAVAGMQAIVRWNDRTKLCTGDACSQAGLDADASARSWALASDIGLGAGAVGVAAAGVLFFTSKGTEAPRTGVVHFAPTVSSTGAGLGLDGIW
jgi:hypothetical protein